LVFGHTRGAHDAQAPMQCCTTIGQHEGCRLLVLDVNAHGDRMPSAMRRASPFAHVRDACARGSHAKRSTRAEVRVHVRRAPARVRLRLVDVDCRDVFNQACVRDDEKGGPQCGDPRRLIGEVEDRVPVTG
jgi:hypothetical protein